MLHSSEMNPPATASISKIGMQQLLHSSKIIPPATASISKIGLQQQQQSSRNHLPATASISKIDLQQLLHQLILKLQQLLGAIHLVLMVLAVL